MLNYRHNFFIFLRTILGSLRHTDWGLAFRRQGGLGVLRALMAALTGVNAWPIFVQADAVWSPHRLRALLRARGVATWGWGYHGGQHYFRVRLRQAQWAQYLLLEAGVPLVGRLLEDSTPVRGRGAYGRAFSGAGRAPGQDDVAARSFDRRGQAQPETRPAVATGDPLDAINRVVDKLAGL